MEKEHKSSTTMSHKIKKVSVFYGVPLKGYVAA